MRFTTHPYMVQDPSLVGVCAWNNGTLPQFVTATVYVYYTFHIADANTFSARLARVLFAHAPRVCPTPPDRFSIPPLSSPPPLVHTPPVLSPPTLRAAVSCLLDYPWWFSCCRRLLPTAVPAIPAVVVGSGHFHYVPTLYSLFP